jgi:hypothetical protein
MLPPTAAIWATGRTRGWVWKKTYLQVKNWLLASGHSSSIWLHRVFLPRPFADTWDNLWTLGGEIIRDLNYIPSRRKVAANKLLRDAVHTDGGPLIYNGSEEEQRSFDSTCRILHRFLSQPPALSPNKDHGKRRR